MVEDLTGKPYQVGDLTTEVDARIKSAVANFCGKEEYVVGSLSAEIDRRVKNRVAEFTGMGLGVENVPSKLRVLWCLLMWLTMPTSFRFYTQGMILMNLEILQRRLRIVDRPGT